MQDDHLSGLSSLTALRHLSLAECKELTDGAMDYLSGLKSLEQLDLGWTGVTDGAVPYLASLKYLQGLNVSNTQVTCGGLAGLGKLEMLDWLQFYQGSPCIASLAGYLTDISSMGRLPRNVQAALWRASHRSTKTYRAQACTLCPEVPS